MCQVNHVLRIRVGQFRKVYRCLEHCPKLMVGQNNLARPISLVVYEGGQTPSWVIRNIRPLRRRLMNLDVKSAVGSKTREGQATFLHNFVRKIAE